AMKPLSVEEAASQMEFLGHEFFFFINAATSQYNVIYR
ncbi:MAG: ribosome-associated translation inhibitor RaiA, partial [Dehalococcoidia bacterium]|nr:ribosome-associated translation inhibitor RaiA [Dehalococcoidia bacterium]